MSPLHAIEAERRVIGTHPNLVELRRAPANMQR
jgi:hypothetical protein